MENVTLQAIKYGTTNLNIFTKGLICTALEFRKGRDSATICRKADLRYCTYAMRIVKHVESIIAYTLMYCIECVYVRIAWDKTFSVLKGSEKDL